MLTEHLGSDSFLHIDTDGAGRLVVRAPGEFSGKPGDNISLKPDTARIHKFDDKDLSIR